MRNAGMKMRNVWRMAFFFAFLHFAVETACFYRLFSAVKPTSMWWTYAFLYDALAFVPQLFLGMLSDRFRAFPMALIGILMILAGMFIPVRAICLLLISLGNAMVHVEGAEATLRGAGGKMGPSGIFVAGGSFGVILGQLLAGTGEKAVWIPCALLVLAMPVLLYLRNKQDLQQKADGFCAAADRPVVLVVALTFVTVAVRSFIGYAIPITWKKTVWQSILLFVCMGIGKAAGGVLADRFGARRVAVISLILALPLLLFGSDHMVISLVGTALFSMTMTVTLGVLVSVFPEAPGMAFGITTVGLFLGSTPMFFVNLGETAQILAVTVLTLVAAGCFLYVACNTNKQRT